MGRKRPGGGPEYGNDDQDDGQWATAPAAAGPAAFGIPALPGLPGMPGMPGMSPDMNGRPGMPTMQGLPGLPGMPQGLAALPELPGAPQLAGTPQLGQLPSPGAPQLGQLPSPGAPQLGQLPSPGGTQLGGAPQLGQLPGAPGDAAGVAPPALGGGPMWPGGMMPPGAQGAVTAPAGPGAIGMLGPCPGVVPNALAVPVQPLVGQIGGPGLPANAQALNAQAIQRLQYQQAAIDYESSKHAGIAPEVSELAEHHGLDDRATRALDEEMKRRKDTFENDMQALWIGLEGAKNPSGLLMIKIRDMRMGTFKGMSALDRTVQEFAKRYRLDAQAAVKLAEVLDKREDAEGDLKKLAKHLERSNKPSSLMMMMLRDLREGKPVKEPAYAAAIGSKEHEKEIAKTFKRKSRSRGSRDRDRRDRREKRERSRDRDRDRRSRSRRK